MAVLAGTALSVLAPGALVYVWPALLAIALGWMPAYVYLHNRGVHDVHDRQVAYSLARVREVVVDAEGYLCVELRRRWLLGRPTFVRFRPRAVQTDVVANALLRGATDKSSGRTTR